MRIRLFGFLAVVFLLLFYSGFKLSLVWPSRKGVTWIILLITFGIMIGSQLLYRLKPEAMEDLWGRTLLWSGSILMGLWGTLLIFMLALDVGQWIVSWGQQANSPLNADSEMSRRLFFNQWITYTILALSVWIAGWGLVTARRKPQIDEIKIPIPDLPPALEGFKIVQLSDFHIGPTIRGSYVEEVVAATNALNPDFIALTGDIADGSPQSMREHVQPLKNLRSTFGTFYVTGNHEYYWGAEAWLEEIRQLGIKPLINEHHIITCQEEQLLVAGIPDISGEQFIDSHRSDAKKALEGGAASKVKILLAHRPNSCFEAEPHGYHLQLSGHTHAGQFFPFSLLIPLAHKYSRGLNLHGRMWVYVNRGTGYWGPPNRFGVPGEITLLTLVKA